MKGSLIMTKENEADLDDVLMFFLEDTIKTIEQIVNSCHSKGSAMICRRRLDLYINLKKEKQASNESLTYENILEKCGYDQSFIANYNRKIEHEKAYFQG